MKKELFGYMDTEIPCHIYTIENSECSAKILDFGATLAEFNVFGRNIVGGFDTFNDYLIDDSHQGGTIGRVANRIENAEFKMDGVTYKLPKNDGENCLHGGCGFDRRMWSVKEHSDDSITLAYTSNDGEEGFPSRLDVFVTYTLQNTGIMINYRAIPYGKTPISLTNHSYFNLSGFKKSIEDHRVMICSDSYTEVSDFLIPIGRKNVTDTPFDLRVPCTIGDQNTDYDHNFVLSCSEFISCNGSNIGLASTVESDGLRMSVYTDTPCLQFYIGNFLGNGPDFKGKVKQIRHGALCLEAQTEPNSVNHGIGFYNAGDVYTQTTLYNVEEIK